jgi:hypothetical protein
VHDRALLRLLDGWVSSLAAQEFVDVLPLVRRTFGSFTDAERRAIATQVRTAGTEDRPTTVDDVDEERALAAVATVARILGVPS